MPRRSIRLPRFLTLAAIVAAASLVAAVSLSLARGDDPEPARAKWRAPAALWLAPDGQTLLAAGAKSGDLMVIDASKRESVAELAMGKSLVALAATPDGSTLAVCDAGANELVLLDRDGHRLAVRARVSVPIKPVSVLVDRDGRTAHVACLWSRQIVRVDLDTATLASTVDLEFAPHKMILLADGETLVVADAFGGKLALVDTRSGRIVRQLEIPGHNFRGLALSPGGQELLVTHMIVTESAGTTRDNIFWGITMTSNLRVIPVSALFDASKNAVREAQTHFLGDPRGGAGDPGEIAVAADGGIVICLGGVGEVITGRSSPYRLIRVPLGRQRIGGAGGPPAGPRPIDVVLSPDGKTGYVANYNRDTIAVVDVPEQEVLQEIELGDMPQPTLEQEGERLFYSANLSLDGWFSCHSCHTDGHTNGQNADTLGDGAYGAPKSVFSLLGAASTSPWAWNGSKRSLDEQVRDSLRHSMQPASPPAEETVAAMTAFLRTLEPPPVAAWQRRDLAASERGERVFTARGCAICHEPPLYSSDQLYDVGLDDGPGGNKRFNPPSLRGLAHSAPYFHDGRAKTIEAVLGDFRHKLNAALPDNELRDLAAFLRSL